jgi:hypothetical protein
MVKIVLSKTGMPGRMRNLAVRHPWKLRLQLWSQEDGVPIKLVVPPERET